MTDIVNPLLQNNPLLNLPENQPYVRMEDLPPEILAGLKAGTEAVLEITAGVDGKFSALLQTGNGSIDINLASSLLETLSDGQAVSLPVRIGTGGRLFLQQPPQGTDNAPVIMPAKTSLQGVLEQVEIAPLKLENFVSQTLENLNVPQNVREQAVKLLPVLEVSLAKVGAGAETSEILQPLQNVLRNIAEQPQNFESLKLQLVQAVEDLAGAQIGGQVAERVNDMTVVTTPLGKTFFASKFKLPLAENVLLNIGAPIRDGLSEIKALDNLLKILLSSKPIAVSPEKLSRVTQIKGLSAIAELKPEFLPVVAKALPLQGENLLENVYRFYQGAANKDIKQWLGQKALAEISSETPADRAVLKELGSFLSNAVKETPGWRIVEMPLFDGNGFAPLKVAVKKDADREKQNAHNKKSGTRFIVETDFSKLGGFQFDGFSSVKQRSLDLIVRTTQNLEDDFCLNIINLFKKSLYALEYTGTIKINRRQAFINLYDENQTNTGIYV